MKFFIAGLLLVSGCSMSVGSRAPSSEENPHFAGAKEEKPGVVEKRDCYAGEERDSEGNCTRVQDIQRPGHRGGRG